jgi:hypothetical protein
MKYIVLLLLLVVLLGCEQKEKKGIIPEPETISEKDEQELKYLKEVEWPKAYREQDTLLLDRILGDDFQMIDNSGAWTNKQDEMNWIKENGTSYDTFRYEIKRLDINENGTAIICGTGHILNDSVETIYHSSNILIKRSGVWKAVASHVSGVKELD